MRFLGYSTGAIAEGDFSSALRELSEFSTDAVELSALRLQELEPLVNALDSLDLRQFAYVSLHAPSSIDQSDEAHVVSLLRKVIERAIPVVVHPDCIFDARLWGSLGEWLCIENMDKRKSTGRSASELNSFFELLPMATFCFDFAHARQYDSSMVEAFRILTSFKSRLRQIHVSEVDTQSHHQRMSIAAFLDYCEVADMVPSDIAVIIEAPVKNEFEISAELKASRRLFESGGSGDLPESEAPENIGLSNSSAFR